MEMRPNTIKPQRPQGLQERLQTIIGAQVVQIAALQSQMEEMQLELEGLRAKTTPESPKP